VTFLVALALALPTGGVLTVVASHSGLDHTAAHAIWASATAVLAIAFWWRAKTPRQALRRGLLALSIEAFAIPLLSNVAGGVRGYVQTGGSLSAGGVGGDAFGSDAFSAYASIVALIFGSPAFILYLVTREPPATHSNALPEKE
jgi:hypothetical protein